MLFSSRIAFKTIFIVLSALKSHNKIKLETVETIFENMKRLFLTLKSELLDQQHINIGQL